MEHEQHTVAVFAPNLHLTVTIEAKSSGEDEVHIHPGGQGFWVARMLRHLGERPLLCGPLGGESGSVLLGLLGQFGLDVSPIEIAASTAVLITDRRSGERRPIAESPPVSLERHEIDDVYGRFFDRALDAGLCVVTGQSAPAVVSSFYARLGHDLHAAGVPLVADIHGSELDALLEGGPIAALKVSHEDLEQDGVLEDNGREACTASIEALSRRGARAVVVSRQGNPAIACFDGVWLEARTPELKPADPRGAGDSMTAGLAAAFRRALDPIEALRLACAAGAANVTRHGLGSADAGLVPSLLDKVVVERLGVTTVEARSLFGADTAAG